MKTEHKFKIGSIYRNGHGALLRLEESGVAGEALLVFASNGVALRHRARLSDGRNLPLDDRHLGLDLLPGELDAQGNPISEQPQGDGGFSEYLDACEQFTGPVLYIGRRYSMPAPAPAVLTVTIEPKREPLDWNKPTPFDPWAGYEVSGGGERPIGRASESRTPRALWTHQIGG